MTEQLDGSKRVPPGCQAADGERSACAGRLVCPGCAEADGTTAAMNAYNDGITQCEKHPGTIWPHDDCPGPGQPLWDTPPNDESGSLLPAWVEPHTTYVARCGECRNTPDQDGGEFRRSPWEAARVVNEVEGWRIENGALLCPDCACIECPACDGTGDEDGFLVSTQGAAPCPDCNGDSIKYRGEQARYDR